MPKLTIPQHIREKAVKDCADLLAFIDKYYKPELVTSLSYIQALFDAYSCEIRAFGFATMTFSNTGKVEYFIPSK